MLPKPEFYTFYNGTEPMEKERVLKLSNAFKVQDGKAPLELEVKVININPEVQHELLEKCQVMKEYGIFIDTIRKYQTEGIENPYELAIKECIKKVRRGKSLQTIADELEEPVDEIRKIYEAVMKAAPDYDIKMIRESLA